MVNGYKKTAIGAVPSEWDVLPFGKVFRTLSNNTLSRDQLNYDSGSIKDIHYGDILILFPEVLDCSRDDIPYVNNNASISGQPLQDGDIIISDTAEDETVGKAVEVSNRANTNIVAGLHTIPCRVKNGKFASGWLGYFINSHYYHDQLIPYIHGTKVSSIARESLADTYIVVPPYDEQKKVVAALADISRLISESEKLIAKYQAMKLGCLQHMFPRKGQTEPDIRLPGFTGAWEQRKLGELVTIERGGSPRPIDAYITEAPDGLNWVKIGDAPEQGRYIMHTEEKIKPSGLSKTRQVFPGDLILSNSMSFGKPYIMGISGCIHDGWLLIRNNQNVFDLKFLCQMLGTEQMIAQYRQLAAGSTVNNLNKELVSNAIVKVPKKTEQAQIGAFLEKLDQAITLHQRKCEKYKMIKQGMMEDLLTGKIRLK